MLELTSCHHNPAIREDPVGPRATNPALGLKVTLSSRLAGCAVPWSPLGPGGPGTHHRLQLRVGTDSGFGKLDTEWRLLPEATAYLS